MSKTNFSTTKGQKLAMELAMLIVTDEPMQNWDECIDEIRSEICKLGDKKYKVPVSAFLLAEDMNKLKQETLNSRYRIKVQDDINPHSNKLTNAYA
jgi:hypothetical protein